MKCSWMVCIASAAALLLVPVSSCAESSEAGYFKSIGGFTGLSTANLADRDDYELVPFIARFSFRLPKWTGEGGMTPCENLEFNVEPFFSQVYSPANRQEVGCGLMIRYSHPVGSSGLRLYLEGGAGPMYMWTDTEEQSTHFNFIDQAGAGIIYDLGEEWSVELGYRFSHISNAGIDQPNRGINGNRVILGVAKRF